jgi:hypothetical protein
MFRASMREAQHPQENVQNGITGALTICKAVVIDDLACLLNDAGKVNLQGNNAKEIEPKSEQKS